MNIPLSKLICLLALVAAFSGVFGCAVSQPVSESKDSVELFLTPDDFEILGSARGSTERFQILGFGFGPKNSYVKAERKAYEEKGGDLLISRVRVKLFKGLMIPGFWLAWFGIENAQDFPIIGTEVYTTGGIVVKMPAWHEIDEARMEQEEGQTQKTRDRMESETE